MQLRRNVGDATAALTLEVGSGIAAVTAASGIFSVSITGEQSAALAEGVYYYDCFLTIGGVPSRVFGGKVTVLPRVTV